MTNKQALTISRRLLRPDKLPPAVKRAFVEMLVTQPATGKTKKERQASYQVERRRVRAAMRKLKG
jgi:hypothetical protein